MRTTSPVICGFCGEMGHRAFSCRLVPDWGQASGLPLETPSGNGPYQGPRRVLKLPPGVSGDELALLPRGIGGRKLSSLKGRIKQHRLALGSMRWDTVGRLGGRPGKVGRDLSGMKAAASSSYSSGRKRPHQSREGA